MTRDKMSPMLLGYLECALWSSHDNSRDDGGDPFDRNYSIDDLAPEALATAARDVEAFEAEHADALACDGALSASRAGHDLWLTRNGHGAGFWDGDWPEPQATILTEAAKRLGETDPYLSDDGLIYLSR